MPPASSSRLWSTARRPRTRSRARHERLYASITNFFAAEARARSNGHLPIELQAFRIGEPPSSQCRRRSSSRSACESNVKPRIRCSSAASPTAILVICRIDAHRSGGYEVVSSKVHRGGRRRARRRDAGSPSSGCSHDQASDRRHRARHHGRAVRPHLSAAPAGDGVALCRRTRTRVN